VKGYLFDENLPFHLTFTPAFPVTHVTSLGRALTDSEVWDYAVLHDLVIVTKDADFSARMVFASPPPRLIHLRVGNMRKREFHRFLAHLWPTIETLICTHKLLHVYQNHIEAMV
jgi:predicted nuclease of predicted toxin-antitoxin system